MPTTARPCFASESNYVSRTILRLKCLNDHLHLASSFGTHKLETARQLDARPVAGLPFPTSIVSSVTTEFNVALAS